METFLFFSSITLCFITMFCGIFKDKLEYYIPLLYQYFLLLSKPYIPFKTEIFKHPSFIEYDVLSDKKYKSCNINIPLRYIITSYPTFAKIKTKDNKSYLVYIIHTSTDKLLLNQKKLSFKIVSVFNQNIYFNPNIISEFKYIY